MTDACPGRDAASFMPLRRAGTATGSEFVKAPAQHRTASRCAASGARS